MYVKAVLHETFCGSSGSHVDSDVLSPVMSLKSANLKMKDFGGVALKGSEFSRAP